MKKRPRSKRLAYKAKIRPLAFGDYRQQMETPRTDGSLTRDPTNTCNQAKCNKKAIIPACRVLKSALSRTISSSHGPMWPSRVIQCLGTRAAEAASDMPTSNPPPWRFIGWGI